jgi:hypothetical protein
MKIALVLLLAAGCVEGAPNNTPPDAPTAELDAPACERPSDPGYVIATPGDGTVVMSLEQWELQLEYRTELEVYADCLEALAP